jgi:hypothetical protein
MKEFRVVLGVRCTVAEAQEEHLRIGPHSRHSSEVPGIVEFKISLLMPVPLCYYHNCNAEYKL